jgi:hypothetical protein
MHSVTFHNLGNADSTRISLDCGRKVLFDYANMRDPNDDEDLRCDLPKELRDDLGDRDYFDVVAFSHLDRDHYSGATDFFYFEHIAKYQGTVDGSRIKMQVLWVPPAITEPLARRGHRGGAFGSSRAIQGGRGCAFWKARGLVRERN